MSNSQPRVNLRQLRNQAKDLHHDSQSSAVADVLARIRQHHPRFADASPKQIEAEFSLQEAQHVIARENGHDSWPKLVAAVEDREVADREGRFAKDALRGLENLHEVLAELLQARLRRASQTDVEVRVQFTDQVTWAEFQGSRPIGCWSYSYLEQSFAGAATFDLPLITARVMDPAFAAILTEVVTGTRHYDTLQEGAHRNFAGGLFEDIEEAWEPVMAMDMHDIEFEAVPEKPRRRVAEPADVVAYVQLSTADGDVALRTCYPFKALVPLLETLAAIGRRGTI